MSPGDRFRFYGHVEEDGVSRHFTPVEEAALGAVIDRAHAYLRDKRD